MKGIVGHKPANPAKQLERALKRAKRNQREESLSRRQRDHLARTQFGAEQLPRFLDKVLGKPNTKAEGAGRERAEKEGRVPERPERFVQGPSTNWARRAAA